MTLGEYRVGISFNPSKDPLVADIKRFAADLIDLIEFMPLPEGEDTDDQQRNEVRRLKALAMTHVEDAAMWAVKAATKGPRE